MEISNFLTGTLFSVIEDVTVKAQISFDKQCLVATIQGGLALAGTRIIERLKDKVKPYPDTLREVMIKENMDLGTPKQGRGCD